MGALCSRLQAADEGAAVNETGEAPKMDTKTLDLTSCSGNTAPSTEHPAVAAWRNNSFAVGLSGAGFLMPYHIGALEVLVEKGVVDRSTPMAGASAGSLVIASYKCGLTFDEQMEHFLEVAHNCRKHGVHRRLRPLVKAQLIEYLPDNAPELVNGTMHVAISRPVPRLRNKMFCSFHDVTDFRKALLASCHLPLLSDGWLFTRFRGKRAFDGGLTNAVPVVPGAQYTARISALPGHCPDEYPLMLNFPRTEELAAAPGVHSPWEFTMQQTNNKAFFPQDDEFLHRMRQRGRDDITKWLESVGFPAALAAGRSTQVKDAQPTPLPAVTSHPVATHSSSSAEFDEGREPGLEDPGGSGVMDIAEPVGEEATSASGAAGHGNSAMAGGSEAPGALAGGTGRVLERCNTRQATEQLERQRQLGAAAEPEVGMEEAAALEAETTAVGRAGQQDVLRRLSQQEGA